MAENLVKAAVEAAGGPTTVGAECKVSPQAVWKWTQKGLPRSEWTGETNYSLVIERLAKDNRYSRERLLATRKAARPKKFVEARA